MDNAATGERAINARRLHVLLNDGLMAFFGAYYTPWNWWCDDQAQPIFTEDSVERAHGALAKAIEAHSGLSSEDAELYRWLLMEAVNSGPEFSDLDGLVEALRDSCRLFGNSEKDRPDFSSRARRAAIAAISALLLDRGALTGALTPSGERYWTAERGIEL